MTPAPILAITPNLALDRTLTLSGEMRAGTLVRPEGIREVAGDKGVNLVRAVTRLGGRATVYGFTAGWNGRKWRALCEEEGLDASTTELPGETRECHILVSEGGVTTEIYEPGPEASLEDYHTLLSSLPKGVYVFTGSLPGGVDPCEVLSLLPEGCIFDTSGVTLESALTKGSTLVSPNERELAAMLGKERIGTDEVRALYDTHGTPVLLSRGDRGAVYVGERVISAAPPRVEVKNPVASGDCLLGAFLLKRAEGGSLEEALRYGVAAGTDNALQGGGARISQAGVGALLERVSVKVLS